MKTLVRSATLAAFGVLLLVSGLAVRYALAHEPHPGLQFSIGARGVSGCNTRASDVTCTLPAGQNFVLEVGIDALPDDIPSYEGFDAYLEYAGVTPLQDASTDEWPECAFPASSYATDGVVLFACARGFPPAGPSSFVGPIGTNTFTCTQSGTISLRHGAREGYTDVVEGVVTNDANQTSQATSHAEGSDTRETLTITCGPVPAQTPGIVTAGTPGPVGPTPHAEHPEITGLTPGGPVPTLEATSAANASATAKVRATATAKAPGGTSEDDNGSSKTWVWIVIVIAGVAAVVVAGGGYWYVRSKGGGTGGGPTSGSGVPSGGAPTSGAGSAGASPRT